MRYSFGFLADGQQKATKFNPEIAAKATAEREKKQKEYEQFYISFHISGRVLRC